MRDQFPDWFLKAHPDAAGWAKMILNRPLPPPAASPAQPPIAVNDAYSVYSGTTSIPAPGILANDSDPQGATLIAVLYSDVDHGVLTLYSNGAFDYTGNAGGIAADTTGIRADTTHTTADSYGGTTVTSFLYRAFNGLAFSEPATVTITIQSAPVVYTLTVDTGTFALTGYDVTLTYNVPSGGSGLKDENGVQLRDSNGVALLEG